MSGWSDQCRCAHWRWTQWGYDLGILGGYEEGITAHICAGVYILLTVKKNLNTDSSQTLQLTRQLLDQSEYTQIPQLSSGLDIELDNMPLVLWKQRICKKLLQWRYSYDEMRSHILLFLDPSPRMILYIRFLLYSFDWSGSESRSDPGFSSGSCPRSGSGSNLDECQGYFLCC